MDSINQLWASAKDLYWQGLGIWIALSFTACVTLCVVMLAREIFMSVIEFMKRTLR